MFDVTHGCFSVDGLEDTMDLMMVGSGEGCGVWWSCQVFDCKAAACFLLFSFSSSHDGSASTCVVAVAACPPLTPVFMFFCKYYAKKDVFCFFFFFPFPTHLPSLLSV